MSAARIVEFPRLAVVPLPEEHSEAWHALRRNYLTASAAAALVGQHAFMTVADLAADKRGESPFEGNDHTRAGQALENAIALWWEDEHSISTEKPTVMYLCGRWGANPDRMVNGVPLDCKATSHEEGRLPAYWLWQLQVQMLCTGADHAHLAVLWGGNLVLRAYVVARDEDMIRQLEDAADLFWSYFDDGLPIPEPSPQAREVRVEVGEGEAALLLDMAEHRAAKDFHEAEAKRLRGEVAALLSLDALAPGSKVKVVAADGTPLVNVSVQNGRESFDTKGLREAHPDIAEQFTRRGDPVVVVKGAKR